MPPLSLNLDQIRAARANLAKQRSTQRAASAELQREKAALEALRRSGADERLIRRAEAQVGRLAESVRASASGARESLRSIATISDRLIRQRDPSVMVQALSTTHPVALLPIAVQTRYDDATTKLMIRIYPDTLHGFTHEEGLKANEVDEGKRYWTARFTDAADATSPWMEIARVLGPSRAAYVVRMTTPTNVDTIGTDKAPVFDDAAIPLAAAESQQVFAQALPDRFVALGFRNGQRIFRKWGSVIPDQLALSPLFDPLLMEDPNNTDPFGGDRKWMVDYPAAEAVGMAITITQADLQGAQMGQGVERLIVLGVDWTQTPESAAELMASLLDNHQQSDGLSFVAQGTPTNNTGATRSGFASNGADVVDALDPSQADAQAAAVADELASAGARLQLLLGIPKPSVGPDGTPLVGFDAGLVPNANLLEGASAGHMINALWNATIGYTLRFFWNPLDSSQTLIEDAAIEQLRAYAVRFLRPGGPLSALRVGNTPYGILPITARGFVPKANSALERELLEATTWFRFHWEVATRSVPTLRNPSAENLHQVLAMQPWALSKRYWQVAGPTATQNQPDFSPYAMWQHILLQFLVGSLLNKFPFSVKSPFLGTCTVLPKPNSLDAVPWVQRDPAQPKRELDGDEPLARNFINALLEVLSTPAQQVRSTLLAMENGESLLEAMLAFAADEEVLHSGRLLFRDHLVARPNLSATIKQQAKRMRPAEYVGVDVVTQVGDQFDVGHANAVLGVKLEGTTGDGTVENFIAGHFGTIIANWPEQLQNIAKFNDSLAFLKDRTAGELGQAFRSTLDLYSHRLDAWITSLATKRLDEMREQSPQGVHIGAYGVVDDLLPDSARPADQAADSYGYVHAPSLQQAATAAILRSGHLANKQASGSPFNIDLRSHRVKRARRLLEGLSSGQWMAALLGYRFERALRDNELSQHILELRRAFPLAPAGEKASDEAKEAISARNVIDGVRLIAEYREKGINHIASSIAPAVVLTAGEKSVIAAIIDDLNDQMDSVADLLLAESVFQIAGGNMDGAGAAMLSLDKQQRPPETRGIDTPHSTRGYTQRVVVVMQNTVPGAWAGVADDDIAARVEPRLNAWLAALLGDPANYVFGARIFSAVSDANDATKIVSWTDSGTTLECSVGELGLSPLALILGSEAQQGGGQSEVQERIGAVLSEKARARPGSVPDREAIVLQADSPQAGKVGLVAFESFAWLLRRLIEKSRPLRRMDMVRAEDGVETEATLNDGEFAGVDVVDLEGRLGQAELPAQAALTALSAAIAAVPADDEAVVALDAEAPATIAMLDGLHAALAQARALGWRSAIPTERVSAGASGASDVQGERVAVSETVERAVGRARALFAEITARLDAAPLPVVTDNLAKRAQASLDRIHAILGKAFPVLPRFTLGAYAADAAATLGDRKTLLDGDDLAIAGWLPKLGCVRETTGLLSDVLSAAEAMGQLSAPHDLKLLQFPRNATDHWGALPLAPNQDLRGVVAVAAHAPAALASIAAADTMAGLFIDEWSESIPMTEETTGLGFHFDAPGARPPQSILLAVPSDLSADHWTLDGLVDVVNEALALARLRAVRPQDLAGLGLILPGIFLSNNFKQDVPTVDFVKMIEANLSLLREASGQNSSQSFMKMAAGTTALFE
jgi:hypothetical protein